ncbi:hypothetical protein MPF_1676 [Methanohalophilus portucalensis FDF-1]|uniref:Uncharacterized protein n=1 Tax=Methanohalophilus portucalensis FDF-1 TaxID=523843 RepID=A0A1L9C336_9EURY|nr:hypothetical protein MPF_1676 [Methanohalophilus portucalensis FDF-1]
MEGMDMPVKGKTQSREWLLKIVSCRIMTSKFRHKLQI